MRRSIPTGQGQKENLVSRQEVRGETGSVEGRHTPSIAAICVGYVELHIPRCNEAKIEHFKVLGESGTLWAVGPAVKTNAHLQHIIDPSGEKNAPPS